MWQFEGWHLVAGSWQVCVDLLDEEGMNIGEGVIWRTRIASRSEQDMKTMKRRIQENGARAK
jgi:hypothetical protein